MTTLLVIEEEVGADGKIILEFPPGKRIRIQVDEVTEVAASQYTSEGETQAEAELEALLNDPTTLTGLGLTAEEILKSPAIGIWKDREDMKDSVAWVEKTRRQSRERRLKRD